MNEASRLLATVALNAAWQLPALVVAAALADLLLRRAPARSRHLLWRVALGLALLLPLLAVVPRGRGASRAAAALPDVPVAVAGAAAPSRSAAGSAPGRLLLPVSGAVGLGVLALLAVAGAFRGSRLLLAFRRAARWRRIAVEERSPRLRALKRECEEALGLGSVALLRAPGLAGPIALGVRRPAVLFPEAFAASHGDDAIRAALAHELAHVKRKDFAANLVHEAALVPFAWHPAARLLRRRLDETREMACDELAATRVLEPRRYARSLVTVAAGLGAAAPALGVNDADILEERVRHLLRPRSGRRRLALAAGVALLLATSLFASFAVVEANPLPVSAPAEWRSRMRHLVGAVVLALGLPASGDDLGKGLEALKSGDLATASASVEKAVAANPNSRDALYTLGVIRWQQVYDALGAEKKDGKADRSRREWMKQSVASGHEALEKALAIDPTFSEALAYQSLLFRLDADLAEDPAQSVTFLAKAKDYLAKSRQAKATAGAGTGPGLAPPPPPPPAKESVLPPPPPPPAKKSAAGAPPPAG